MPFGKLLVPVTQKNIFKISLWFPATAKPLYSSSIRQSNKVYVNDCTLQWPHFTLMKILHMLR